LSRNFNAGGDITLAYATPVLSRLMDGCKGLNRRLRQIILQREREQASTNKSNVGGWHSELDMLTWPNPEVAELLAWVAVAVKSASDFAVGPEHESGDADIVAWANVLRNGDYHQPHYHPNSDWSGVYYVVAGDEDPGGGPGGRIDMLDPRAGVGVLPSPGNAFLGTMQFVPRAGLVLVFPSYLVHHVHPYAGAGERISVAFNVRMLNVRPAGGGRPHKWW
jgi:uncharacterized protein (TIGR02466 family)